MATTPDIDDFVDATTLRSRGEARGIRVAIGSNGDDAEKLTSLSDDCGKAGHGLQAASLDCNSHADVVSGGGVALGRRSASRSRFPLSIWSAYRSSSCLYVRDPCGASLLLLLASRGKLALDVDRCISRAESLRRTRVGAPVFTMLAPATGERGELTAIRTLSLVPSWLFSLQVRSDRSSTILTAALLVLWLTLLLRSSSSSRTWASSSRMRRASSSFH
jgi:hypothetical protein